MTVHPGSFGSTFAISSTTSTDGTALAYRIGGDPSARPLVLVHGWAQSSQAWGFELLTELAKRFRVIAVDLRGHGHSDVATSGYDCSRQWADDLASVLAAAGVEQGAILLGWSYGGIVVSDYLAHRGEGAVGGIVLCGAATAIGSSAGGKVGPAMLRVAEGAFDTDPKRAISALASFGSAMMRGEDGAGQQRMFGLSLATPPQVRLQMLNRRVDNDETLRGLTVPGLILHGRDDGVVLPSAGRANADLMPNGRYVEFADCAHAPFLEVQEQFLAELYGFADAL